MTRDFQNVVTVLWHGPAVQWIGAISGCVLLAGFVYFALALAAS